MTDPIATDADAYVVRTGPFWSRKRYTSSLHIGGVETPIHAHSRTLRTARRQARYLAFNAAELLEDFGLMSTAYAQVKHAREGDPSLPKVGDIVYLTEDIGFIAEGTECVVTASGWDEAEVGEFQFPITAAPVDDSSIPLPLRIDEYTTEVPHA